MKAAVFHKPGDIRYDTVEDQRIENDGDVILKQAVYHATKAFVLSFTTGVRMKNLININS